MGKSYSKPTGKKNSRRRVTRPRAFKQRSYVIESIDPLGQGVAKSDDEITFIAKTLPQETVTAQVVKKKKGVSFAQLKSVDIKAANRLEAECPHYAECPGCHFLHTDYASELEYKKLALARAISRLGVSQEHIQVFPAEKRDRYRNRIQLHYRNATMGLVDGLNDKIIEIPQCRLVREELASTLSNFYSDKSWQQQLGDSPGEGHCELYLKDGEVQVAWNLAYSHGGFTQVYQEMNERLRERVNQYLTASQLHSLLELFAGDGNLSQQFSESAGNKRCLVDVFEQDDLNEYYPIDLFADNALKIFQKNCSHNQFEIMLVDPPRKGFPALNSWVHHYRPKLLLYISCNAATMVRDLMNLEQKCSIKQIELLDLFPSTYHFETLCVLAFD